MDLSPCVLHKNAPFSLFSQHSSPGIHNTLEMKGLQETHIIILKIPVFENREHKRPMKRADEKIISKCHFEVNPQDIRLWLTVLWYP